MVKPAVMGGAMGLMMMWMLHGFLTGDGMRGWALVAFVAAHVVVVALAIAAALFAARLSPRAQALLARVHRPSLGHVSVMLGAAFAVGLGIHLAVHTLGVV